MLVSYLSCGLSFPDLVVSSPNTSTVYVASLPVCILKYQNSFKDKLPQVKYWSVPPHTIFLWALYQKPPNASVFSYVKLVVDIV